MWIRLLALPLIVGLLTLAACGRARTPEPTKAATTDQTASGSTKSESSASATKRLPPIPPRPVVAAPPTGYAWDGQASVAGYKASFDQAVNAAVGALQKVGFPLDQKQSRRSIDSALLIGIQPQTQRPARIDVKPMSATRVEVRATVGAAGDRSSSERVLDLLSASLGGAQ